MRDTIISAIQGRVVVRFDYKGAQRIVEPYCFGRSSAGHDLLRAYQVGGYSESGKPEGWKLFRVQEIFNLHDDVNEQFHVTRPGYNPLDSAMFEIYCSH